MCSLPKWVPGVKSIPMKMPYNQSWQMPLIASNHRSAGRNHTTICRSNSKLGQNNTFCRTAKSLKQLYSGVPEMSWLEFMNFLKLHESFWTPVYHHQVPRWQPPPHPQLRTGHPVTTRSSAAAPTARHQPALQRAPTAPVSQSTPSKNPLSSLLSPEYYPVFPPICICLLSVCNIW